MSIQGNLNQLFSNIESVARFAALPKHFVQQAEQYQSEKDIVQAAAEREAEQQEIPANNKAVKVKKLSPEQKAEIRRQTAAKSPYEISRARTRLEKKAKSQLEAQARVAAQREGNLYGRLMNVYNEITKGEDKK